MMKIYVASSWRNPHQPGVVGYLRREGHEVYDFRNPKPGNTGFQWSEIDPDWMEWSKEKYRECLKHPIANEAFKTDLAAMIWADVFVGVMPFGRSASFEMGWAAGRGKKTILLLEDGEPELMVKMFDYICCSLDEVGRSIEVQKEDFDLHKRAKMASGKQLYSDLNGRWSVEEYEAEILGLRERLAGYERLMGAAMEEDLRQEHLIEGIQIRLDQRNRELNSAAYQIHRLESKIRSLSNFILDNLEEDIQEGESACDVAIRLLKKYREEDKHEATIR